MIIAAFDIASDTGCCDGAAGGPPRLWSWFLRDAGDGRPERLHAFGNLLAAYFQQCGCDGVVYEAPMPLAVMARIGAREETVAFLRGAIGVLEETCVEYGKPVEALNVQDARQSVLGWRTNKGGNTKKRVVDEVTKLHGIAAENDNEADAWVLWTYACNRANPRLAHLQQPLFRGG